MRMNLQDNEASQIDCFRTDCRDKSITTEPISVPSPGFFQSIAKVSKREERSIGKKVLLQHQLQLLLDEAIKEIDHRKAARSSSSVPTLGGKNKGGKFSMPL